ncbi:interleukin-10 [Lepisosteus oculatus]|uniref:Interleukin family protein n=1 Tax=Lepisosteus oculatus TaxID=7918 RepID=W5N369_LEPOC|nr:PREDICTED: interleukin-10 [Lepisosteus oculatus]
MAFSWLSTLLFLLSALLVENTQIKKNVCWDNCCLFIENFPVRLKELRTAFSQIRDYYEASDELIDTALLDEALLEELHSPFGCHAMKEVLRFYLDLVLPAAVKDKGNDFKHPLDSIGNIFIDLKANLNRCRRYFSCKKTFEIENITNEYRKMEGKGLYKAMGELDLLFNYIEEYLVRKRSH